jgi:protein-disulfide isomerase
MNARIAGWHIRSSIRFSVLQRQLTVRVPSFPSDRSAPEIAAESAEFAGAAGMFWDMHDALFENQSRLSITTILLIGEELGLPETAMRNALEAGQFRNKVRSDFMGGVRSGVNGTPAIFTNGVRHDGPYDYASLVGGIQMRFADTRT